MKDIQNKKRISRKLIVIHVSGLCQRKETLKLFSSCPAYAHAPPYFCHQVRNHLDREMAGWWIGRDEPITWPPRPPDLTPVDFLSVV
jgi:hypothetical protein